MDASLLGDGPGGKRRREINLGGTRSAPSYNDILSDAKQRRLQRNDLRRRQEAATRIQRTWRGHLALRDVRRTLRATFDQQPTTLTALRCLVLLGQDEEALGIWSTEVTASETDILLQSDPSHIVLLQRASLHLLHSLSSSIASQHAFAHANALSILLSENPQRANISQHLISHGLYPLLRNVFLQMPVPAQKVTLLPPIQKVIVAPFGIPALLPEALRALLLHILSIPLLPNRLHISDIGSFVANLPFDSLHLVSPQIVNDITLLSTDSKAHLLANFAEFVLPRYIKGNRLSMPAFETYLQLSAAVMNALPTMALEPPENKKAAARNWADEDDDDEPLVEFVASFEPQVALPQLDGRTRKRLQKLPTLEHISKVLVAFRNQQDLRPVFDFCFALSTVWPTRRDKVLSQLFAFEDGNLVRNIYRQFVRSTPLGQGETFAELSKPEHAPHWRPLLLLADLYVQALLTMGDDKFFAGPKPIDTVDADGLPRNPLMLDELAAFARTLLNIAFALYWREDPTSMQDTVPGLPYVRWEHVRDKATKALQALHARDSRRPFTRQGQWLVSAQVDMNSFIQAAIAEERQLAGEEGTVGAVHGRHGAALSKRQIAYLSPRLGVLNNIPFAIPFDVRVNIFRQFVINDMASRGFSQWRGRMGTARVTIRRTHIAQDGFDKLGDVDLKGPIAITFVDQFGQEEAGIDGGGVFKEFLTSLCKEVFDTNRGLWLTNAKHELYPASHSFATDSHSLAWYRFIGRILGKALYEGILVDVAFAGFFLSKWLGKQSLLDDYASYDPQAYQSLIIMKQNPETDVGVSFDIMEDEFGVLKVVDLIPNGRNIPVTAENRLQYIYVYAHYHVSRKIKRQSDAFFEGLSEIIDPKWLRMFNQQEVQILLGGVNSPIDIDDLRAHTQYGGLYSDQEPTIQMFWQVVKTLPQEDRRKLLRFATSCSRPPLLGFKELNPNFAIRDASDDQTRLPTASTCVNLLKLPRYKDARVLREKLIQAINSNAGFDLS